MKLWALAPGKVNLCLFLGDARDDGRHELLTLFQSLSLADTLTLTAPESRDATPAHAAASETDISADRDRVTDAQQDRVICSGVSGPNLVDAVIAKLRASGWNGPPVSIEINKRIPVAAGMAGGSADAAAALRLAAAVAPVAADLMVKIAAELGSDIPGQLTPGVSLGAGAGDVVAPLATLAEHAYVVIPSEFQLSTAAVYRESDRLGLGRPAVELQRQRDQLTAALSSGRSAQVAPIPPELIVNDLQPAALSLCPQIQTALDAALEAGADKAIVSGSGPTAVGIWWGKDAATRAASAEKALVARHPGSVVALPVGPESGTVKAI